MEEENRNQRDAYLLDRNWVDMLKAQGKSLRNVSPEEKIKHKVYGPILVEGAYSHDWKKALLDSVENQEWYTTPEGGRTKLIPYIYIHDKVNRRLISGLSLDDFFNKIKEGVK